MEGHGGLPSAADVQGKSLPRGPLGYLCGSSPRPVAVSALLPQNQYPVLGCSHTCKVAQGDCI